MRRSPGTFSGFAATCALEAAFLAAPYALGDRVAILAAQVRPVDGASFGGLVFGWTIVAALTVFPAAFVAGGHFSSPVFPFGRRRERVAPRPRSGPSLDT